jgi:signal transduction histidine kinase
LKQLKSQEFPGQRVRVRGVLTALPRPGELVIQDQTSGLRIQHVSSHSFKVYEELDVVGFLSSGPGSPMLQETLIQREGDGPAPLPVRATPGKILLDNYQDQLIVMEGAFHQLLTDQDKPVLVLQAETIPFAVQLAFIPDATMLKQWRAGPRLQVKGVCSVLPDAAGISKSFEVWVPSPQDLKVMPASLSLTLPQILQILTLFGLISFALLAWFISLWHRMRRQIALMEQRHEHEMILQKNHEQLRLLSVRLAAVSEEERRSLARELHDQVGQNLTVVGLHLKLLQTRLAETLPAWADSRLEDAYKLVEAITRGIRNVMAELRPQVLDDYGLAAALRGCTEQFTSRGGLAVELAVNETEPRPPSAVETALFRIAQEALTNILKHAKATQVKVQLESDPRKIKMTIEDNGAGFAPVAAASQPEKSGWGLVMMRERAKSVGGHCDIRSELSLGTRVVVEVAR